jgi:3-(3-hydroxy-phenyl)propionate hydroxylase
MVVDAFEKNPAGRPPKCFQFCWPSRPGTFLPGPGALRRWEIKLLPGEDPQAFGTADNVTRVLGTFTDVSKIELWRSAVYRFHALLAQRWSAGRVFLMGDAVHQTPPFMGQGLCAGIRDALNLAWKLAAVIRGQADVSLLESYETERKPHVRTVVSTSKEFGKIIGELDVEAARARDRRLRAELNDGTAVTNRQKFIPDIKGGLTAVGAVAAGTLFPQPFVHREGSIARLDDVIPPGFAIFAADSEILNALTKDSAAAWAAIGGSRVLVAETDGAAPADGILLLQETEGLFADWLARNGVKAAVVRPDHCVFGAAANATELNSLVSDVTARLVASSQQSTRSAVNQ